MDLEKLQRDIKQSYKSDLNSLNERVENILTHVDSEWNINNNEYNIHEIKTIATTILDVETRILHDEVEMLLAQKEQIERSLERRSEELQESKYSVFNALETSIGENDQTVANLHQVKLQSIDLFDLLGEMVESAIITALEKDQDGNIKETIAEVIKELTFEAIKEGSLNTIRVRKILATILQAAIDIAEATPNRASIILEPTLKGMRSGLVRSIDRFKQRLEFMPVEAKHILIEDYDTIIEDLNQTDVLFSQVVQTKADESSPSIKKSLLAINQSMRYDLEELVLISKETAEVMKSRFSSLAKNAVKRADNALNSQAAQEAKRMGAQALGVARTALGTALKSAKGAMDNKK